jgi:hypothetical protein
MHDEAAATGWGAIDNLFPEDDRTRLTGSDRVACDVVAGPAIFDPPSA